MSGPVADTWRMERVRLATIRSTYVVTGAALVVSAAVATALALLHPSGPLSSGATAAALTAGVPFLPVPPLGVLVATLGVLVVAHDYRYGLIRAVFTAQPRRSVVVGARMLLLAVTSGGLAVLTTLLAAVVCAGLGRAPAHDPTTLRLVGSHVLLVVAWT